jgi:hypothetical protein
LLKLVDVGALGVSPWPAGNVADQVPCVRVAFDDELESSHGDALLHAG